MVLAAKVILPVLGVPVIVIVSALAFVVSVMPSPATRVRVSVLESATTELCPAIAIVEKLFDAEPPTTVVHVLSPLKYVVLSLVPDTPSLATGTVPDVRFEAFNVEIFAAPTPAAVALFEKSELEILVKSALAK
jgi:hypothetical protein